MNYGEIYGPIYQAVILIMPHIHTSGRFEQVMCKPQVHAAFLFLLGGSGHEAGDDAVAKS